jgi:uncharacterized protein (TIGR02453 family)
LAKENSFQGFPREAVKFFVSLRKNNNREWFSRHKNQYTTQVMEPAQALVRDLGDRLKKISPAIIAAPMINRSIFRLNRDTRFSPDKSPYKTHLGLFFWEGVRPRMECPGFYLHLEPPHLMLGMGLYMLPRSALESYRHAVVHPEFGAELADIMAQVTKLKGFTLGGKHYKRYPAEFDTTHPNADLLLHNGLYAGTENPIPEELYSRDLLDYCMQRYQKLSGLHHWLVNFNARLY